MKKLAFLFALLALPSLADSPKREIFPSDYKPSACAPDAATLCKSFQKERMADHGGNFRGFNIKQEWVNAHWDEMLEVYLPICAKIANCLTVKGNTWVFCADLMGNNFVTACERFPAGSQDREQCGMFATIYFLGIVGADEETATQACLAAQPATGPRKLEAWLAAPVLTPEFNGKFTAYALDAETHIPVRAFFTIDAGTMDGNRGPTSITGSPVKWRAGFRAVPNAQGHREFVAPTATFTAEGYEPLTIPVAIEVPKLTVTMTPPPAELKPGTNTITVTTLDAATAKPVEMRVMAGDRVLGKANAPLQLEWKRGEKRPEIWVTSLWNRYSDVVVAPQQ